MGYTVPTTEPTSLRAGDTWQWRREDLSDYPASTWTLTYYFRNASAHFDVVASADGDLFAVSVAPATTGAYTAGEYDWYAFVDDGTDRYQIDSGRLEVLVDVSAAAAADGRVFARRILDYVEAALENKATADQLDVIDVQLNARGLKRSPENLWKLRSQLLVEAKREESANAGRDTRLKIRFVA